MDHEAQDEVRDGRSPVATLPPDPGSNVIELPEELLLTLLMG